jgi:pyruvate, water dikinase
MIRDWFKFRGRRRQKEGTSARQRHAIEVTYARFKELLSANADLLATIVDLEEKMAGRAPFTLHDIRTSARHALRSTRCMVESLNAISEQRYTELYSVLDSIGAAILRHTDTGPSPLPPEMILPYARIDGRMIEWVGSKNAHLGEMRNRIGLPVPDGFAITATAFLFFLAQNGLDHAIGEELSALDVDNPTLLEAVSEKIQRRIISSPVPAELAQAILTAFDALFSHPTNGGDLAGRVAMRSSASGEDGELSFAGQYRSMLNVARERVVQTYGLVVASLYSPRAIAYRQHQCIPEEGLAMSVACLQMVDAMASGVIYSQHPHEPVPTSITISAVWGLGPYAVGGHISPDLYTVARDDDFTILRKTIADKHVQLVCTPEGGLREISVPQNRRDQACLADEQIKTLAAYAMRLEHHYGCAQDAEWALTPQGHIVLLQTRPLHIADAGQVAQDASPVPDRNVLVAGGEIAVRGVARGPAWHIRSEADLAAFPHGAVLVARHSSPKYVVVMHKSAAVVTDAGSITGHMASLCREFGVPAILNMKTATRTIGHGELITVDADTARIYRGTVPELQDHRVNRPRRLAASPLFAVLRGVAELITPLNLLDPQSVDFQPTRCATLHDIGRFVHEHSYQAMFHLSADAAEAGGHACKLIAPVPLDLYLIDLGGGFVESVPATTPRVTPEQVASTPLRALLEGLQDERLVRRQPRAVDLGGFLSIVQAQMLSGPDVLGERSYALISDKYLNFSSRVGYHYSILDAYCGRTINKNYITFRFKGGAADDLRRHRRARVIARILEAFGFGVAIRSDQVDARFQKYDHADTAHRLAMLGRLLQFSRQLDMLMADDESVDRFTQAFLRGDYLFDGA